MPPNAGYRHASSRPSISIPGSRATMTRLSSYAAYRLRVVRVGLVLSWLGLITLTGWSLWRNEPRSRMLIAALLAAALVILTVVPWRRTLETPLADILLTLGSAIAIIGLVIVELPRTGTPVGVGYLLVVLFAAATITSDLLVVLTSALALAAYSYAAVTPPDATIGGSALLISTFAAACVLVFLLAGGIKSRLHEAGIEIAQFERRERELADKERELSRMYDISRTIGAGSNLGEVLPELVGRMARVVHAELGLVALYVPDEELLRVMSPIWVKGHVIPSDPVDVALTERTLITGAFISSESACVDGGESACDDRLLADLDVRRAVAVPLRVGARRIGVVLLADTPTRFTPQDVAVIESMSAPAALVLDQLARYEQATTEGAKMAELAELKTEFVSVVSHELRTPLTSIIGTLGTLQRAELQHPDPTARELIATAGKQTERLRTLIEDLLVVSRLDAEALPIRTRTLAAHNFLEEVVDSVPGARGHVSLSIGTEVERIDADPDHLGRILRNLVENALKYAEGSPIEVGARVKDDEVLLFVVDHGPGIEYRRRDEIFERFTQLQDHETRSMGGTGLGLYIVRGLTEAMGGRVWYEPTIGGGATFVVALRDRTPDPEAARAPGS